MKKLTCLILCLVFGATSLALGQGDYPSRPVEYVVPAAAGGGTDVIARMVAEALTARLGQPFMVVNKPGGGTIIGATYVAKEAKADGYTLLSEIHSSSSMVVAGMVNPPYSLEDKAWISRVATSPIVFAVHVDAPWKNFREFGEWVKSNPEKLTWASVGPSGLSAYGVQEWLTRIGVDGSKTRMVPSKGAADSLPKVAGGHVVLACHTVAECYTLAKAGKVRVLAVSSDKRDPALPDVPTAKEQGVDGLTVSWWTGLTTRAGTPTAIIEKLNKAVGEICSDPEFQNRLKARQGNPAYLSSSDFRKFVYDETKAYTVLAEKIGIRK
jgi:tripartite-type tricarboxylate transporter receptor subunit TctC